MTGTLESGIDTTLLAGRLTGNEPWNQSDYPLSNGLEEAAASGMDAVVAEPNELQLDIDNADAYTRCYSMLGMVSSFFKVTDLEAHPSKSGGDHKHITLTLSCPLSSVERILLQAILGSDPKRELLSYIRLLKGDVGPATMFFEKP